MNDQVLLVDDDPQSLESTRRILELAQYHCVTASQGKEALATLEGDWENRVKLVISDIRMPEMSGLELFELIRNSPRNVPVILMTAFGQVEDAVQAMKAGASDFLLKPFKKNALLEAVEVALKLNRTSKGKGLSGLSPVVVAQSFRLIGQSAPIQALNSLIEQIAPTDVTVLLEGDSGTGKERVAQLIHRLSSRRDGPFIAVNCAAVPEHLIESEFFGHEKGAFSGAVSSKKGLFEQSHLGTLFLDEISELSLSLQAKLLRVIQESEVRPVGGQHSRKIDLRIISASNKKLREKVKEGLFREDLMFRLEVMAVQLPRLAERVEDIPLLVQAFLQEHSSKLGKEVLTIHPEALHLLVKHEWPGNVRELSNVIERACVLCDGVELKREHLPLHIQQMIFENKAHHKSVMVPIGTSLKDMEDLLIQKTLEATDGNKTLAAKLLGVNSRTIYRKLDR